MHSVEVQILGQSYSIRTDEDEKYIRSLANYIDEKLKEIHSAAPNTNHSRAMVITVGWTINSAKMGNSPACS